MHNALKFNVFSIIMVGLLAGCGGGSNEADTSEANDLVKLGREIFFDTSLSEPQGLSCSSCHNPEAAFSDPSHTAASKGAKFGSLGLRNAQALTYSSFSPLFGFSAEEQDFIGGQFWDGAAATFEEQAKRPFFRDIEMNLPSHQALSERLQAATYAARLRNIFGENVFSTPEVALDAATQAIGAFERSSELQPFSSKYDHWVVNRAALTDAERRGLEIFEAADKGNCAACHPSVAPVGDSRKGALFTDFTYDNIGLPAKESSGVGPDNGLQNVTGRADDAGRFKVPTLRNVALTAPYFHNGVFQTLLEVVHFYNSRDVDGTIAKPEIPLTMNREELGNLGMTREEELDLVAFLGTLSDGFSPTSK